MNEKMQKAIRKAQAAIAKADDPASTPEEAASYRAAADAIMFKYKIESLSAPEQNTFGTEIIFAQMPIVSLTSEFAMEQRGMAGAIARHADVEGVWIGYQKPEGASDTYYMLELIGFESDVAYAQMLITSALLAFGKKLEPAYDGSASDAENAYRMRAAGMEGHRIAQAIWGRDEKPLRVKARNLAKDLMISRGEDPEGLFGRGVNVKAYRLDYAAEFVYVLNDRMSRLRATRESGGLVLADSKERVREFLYERHPNLRPSTAPVKAYRAPNADCAKCKAAKSGYCRDHAWLRPSRARVSGGRQYSAAGARAGANAARTVDLGGGGTGRVSGSGGSTRAIG